jgi:hypothetical protein
MKLIVALGYLFAFTVTAVAGLWLGGQAASQIPATEVRQSPALSKSPPAGQFNLLITHVQHLETRQPGLHMIWLVAIQPDTPIQFIPIYPSSPNNPGKDSELSQIFRLKRHGSHFVLDTTLTESLEERGVVWDGTIIMDSRALADFIETFGQIQVNGINLDQRQLAANQFPDFETTQQSLTFQTLLWREICWNILHSPAYIPDLSPKFKKHASWFFSQEIENLDWIALLSSANVPSCEFPLFQRVNP